MLLTQGSEDMTHWYLGASIHWTRTKPIHLLSLDAYDVGQDERDTLNGALFDHHQKILLELGNEPWLIGADFNQQPGD